MVPEENGDEAPSCLSGEDLGMLVAMAREKKAKLEVELIQEQAFQEEFGLAMNRDSGDVQAELDAFGDLDEFEARLRAIPRCR